MRRVLLILLLGTTLFTSGCYFTAGFSRTAPKTTVCNINPGYDVTHYRPAYADGGANPNVCGSAGSDCSRAGYCCPGGLCGESL